MLQGRAPHSEENQNLGRTLPENSGWSVRKDGDSTHSLPSAPQPMDISSVLNTNGFFWPDSDESFWPPFQRGTIWQLDVDLPLTAEPDDATGAARSALSELDLSPLCNQSTQGCDSVGVSRDLIDYLSLGEKVRTDATILAQNGRLYHMCSQISRTRRDLFQVESPSLNIRRK